MTGDLLIDVLLWTMVGGVAACVLMGLSVLAVFVAKVIKDMIKNF